MENMKKLELLEMVKELKEELFYLERDVINDGVINEFNFYNRMGRLSDRIYLKMDLINKSAKNIIDILRIDYNDYNGNYYELFDNVWEIINNEVEWFGCHYDIDLILKIYDNNNYKWASIFEEAEFLTKEWGNTSPEGMLFAVLYYMVIQESYNFLSDNNIEPDENVTPENLKKLYKFINQLD